MRPSAAFELLKKELGKQNIDNVAMRSGVNRETLRLWLSDGAPKFPRMDTFNSVCKTLKLEVEIKW